VGLIAREIERAGRLGLTADVTPNHLIRNLGSIERRLGPERSRTAHAWRSLIRAGVRLISIEDIPGGVHVVNEVTIERDGGDKPCCVAESVVRYYT